MNATTASTHPLPRHRPSTPRHRPAPRVATGTRDATPGAEGKRRRRTVVVAVATTFLGAYALGVTWFASSLNADMARSYQLAPAVQDVEHR